MGLIQDETAVSEIIGEILMIAVVVVAFGVISTFVYTYLQGPDNPPEVDVTGIADDTRDTIYLKHSGGEWVGADELKVILRINDTTYQYNYTGEFRLGDVIMINVSEEYGIDLKRGEEATILLIHTPTGEMVTTGELGYRAADCSEDSTPPSSITNLRNTTFELLYIIWAWDKPADEDYSHAEVYIDGTYMGTTSANWYNATGFEAGSDHMIGTRTVDTCGNVNTTWVNDSARTFMPWWDAGWGYRRPVNITSSDALSDYQIRFYIPYYGDMQSDFDDLRFTTQDDSPILYWLELKSNSDWASVWVKVPSITDGNTTLYMYYGNSSAENASNTATFEFFDGFDTWSGWTNYSSGGVVWDSYGAEDVLNKVGNNDPNGGWKSFASSIADYRLVVRERRDSGGSGGSMDRYGIEDGSYNGYGIYRTGKTAGSGNFGFERRTTGSGSNAQYSSLNQPYNNWYITELKKDGTSLNASLYNGDDRSHVGSQAGTDSAHSGPFDRVAIRGGWSYYVDWIAVAEYSTPEPSYTIGDEEAY